MKRTFCFLAGLSMVVLAGTGCGGEPFTATGGAGGTGGTGGSVMTTGGTGGSATTTGDTGGSPATGGAGGGTASGGAGGTGGGPMCQPLSDDCTQCAFGACQDLYCQCYGNADCPALVNCLQPCDPADDACIKPCLSAHEDSISTAFLLGDCTATPCSDVCMGVAAQQACPKCLFEQCPVQMNDCLADPDCYDILMCAIECPPNDFVCALGCTSGKPQESTNRAAAVQACTTDSTKCSADCSGG